VLKAEGARFNMTFTPVPADADLRTALPTDANYLYAEVPGETEGSIVRLLHVSTGDRDERGRPAIPMQFGRDIAARLLLMPERAHWKACALSKADETVAADRFKAAFAKHSPF
jgi:Protein similar to CwfJ C-terminus 2